ncbi:MAG TPA: hypothetical protein VKV17_06120 [Bryobacteraceae bacterium]|nr:hypothetical protein [Bryobacteraceae bacterium]
MTHRIGTLVLVLAEAALPLLAQTSKTNAKPWTPARTADGQPDLQGVWTDATITPFERPAALASKPVLSAAEAAQLEKQAAAANSEEGAPKPGDVGSYNEFWFDRGTKVVKTRQASLVVDPPDGRVPVTAAAEAKRDYNMAHTADSYEYMSTWDRCITRGVPGDMFPAGYNNSYQIVQAPGYVVILAEMIHDARVIPLDGRAHLPVGVGQWNGDSRGHWEGNTLVIDTTNFNGKGWIASNAASGRIKGIPESTAAHIVERFTRVDADTILYEATIDDPQMYTKPWKVEIPLTRDPGYVIYEYACHEGNYAMVDILNGGRVQEKEER